MTCHADTANVGAFPEVAYGCLPELRRLELHSQKFVNDTSSLHCKEVLEKLAKAGYVKEVRPLAQAEQRLSGRALVKSKFALIEI